MKRLQWHARIQSTVKVLERFVDRVWYPVFLGFLAAIDHFVVIVPTDGLLVSSAMLTPKRWFFLALSVALGSTLGGVVLGAVVQLHGLPWIESHYPALLQSEFWSVTTKYFDQYGLFAVFLMAATPLAQQPVVVLASLAKTPLGLMALVVFAGRLIKFLIMAYIGSHAPRLLARLWGVKGDLKDVGIDVK